MKLSRQSRIYRYAYFFGSDWERAQTRSNTLCALFWRCVRTTMVGAAPLVLLAIFLTHLYVNTYNTLIFVAGVAVFILGIVVVNYLDEWKLRRRLYREDNEGVPPSKLVQLATTAFWGIKHKVCPTIQIVD